MDHRIFSLNSAVLPGITQPVEQHRLHQAKRAFSTRRIDLSLAMGLAVAKVRPKAGDLVLATVDSLGQHKRLEDQYGRRVTLYPGDEILVAYGNHYATDQFHALVPETLAPCHLVAGGGIASQSDCRSAKMRAPTAISPIGIVVDAAGEPLSTQAFAITDTHESADVQPTVVAVLGSSMNAGKTTTVSSLVHAERAAGRRVGAIKVTGTGSGGDLWSFTDAGADAVLDFTDAGYPSTYRLDTQTHCAIFNLLLQRMATLGMEIVFVEIADGLLFQETADFVQSTVFQSKIDGVIFAAGDAMGALNGVDWLTRYGLPPLAVAGCLTASPLAVEEVRTRIGTPIVSLEAMQSGEFLASEHLQKSLAA